MVIWSERPGAFDDFLFTAWRVRRRQSPGFQNLCSRSIAGASMSQPTPKLTALVDARDNYCCIRCGISLSVTDGSRHHRMRRRDGGHRASNLVLLCGSGTTGCHGWAHSNPAAARSEGIIVPANGRALPELIPVFTWWLVSRVWMMLDDSGDRDLITGVAAAEMLSEYGLTEPSAGEL